MVELELTLLNEIGRVVATAAEIVEDLERTIDLRRSSASFASVVRSAQRLAWARDPFDRLIAANALADGASLVTADQTILSNLPEAVWD